MYLQIRPFANTKARKLIKSEKIGPSISETKNQWLLRLGQMKISASKNPQMKKKIGYLHTYALLPKHGRLLLWKLKYKFFHASLLRVTVTFKRIWYQSVIVEEQSEYSVTLSWGQRFESGFGLSEGYWTNLARVSLSKMSAIFARGQNGVNGDLNFKMPKSTQKAYQLTCFVV